MFSFVPHCQGECGSQKYTAMSVATLKLTCAAISLALAQCERPAEMFGELDDLRRDRVPRGAGLRSVIVATCDFPPRPRTRSPSQWPGTAGSATSVGRSEIDTMSFSPPRAPLPRFGPLRRRRGDRCAAHRSAPPSGRHGPAGRAPCRSSHETPASARSACSRHSRFAISWG